MPPVPALDRPSRRRRAALVTFVTAPLLLGLALLPGTGAQWTFSTARSGSWASAPTFSASGPTATATPTPTVVPFLVGAHAQPWGTKTAGTAVDVQVTSVVPAGRTLVLFVTAQNTTATEPLVVSVARPPGESATWNRLHTHCSSTAGAATAVTGTLLALRTTVPWPVGGYPATLSASTKGRAAVLGEFGNVDDTRVVVPYSDTSKTSRCDGFTQLDDPAATMAEAPGGLRLMAVSHWGTQTPPSGPSVLSQTRVADNYTPGGGSAGTNVSTALFYDLITDASGPITFAGNPAGPEAGLTVTLKARA